MPEVQWGLSPTSLTETAAGSGFTYNRSDLCGAPATTDGWVDPGYLQSALMTGLKDSTRYYYKYGMVSCTPGWSGSMSLCRTAAVLLPQGLTTDLGVLCLVCKNSRICASSCVSQTDLWALTAPWLLRARCQLGMMSNDGSHVADTACTPMQPGDYSPVHSFLTAGPVGSTTNAKMILIADLGHTELDYSDEYDYDVSHKCTF